jgi:hypothetical protein
MDRDIYKGEYVDGAAATPNRNVVNSGDGAAVAEVKAGDRRAIIDAIVVRESTFK